MSRRLAQFSKKKPCYICGNPNEGREHAPPEMLLEGLDCHLITVPSCQLHNTEKSGSDQAFLTWLSMATQEWLTRYHKNPPETILQAIRRISADFQQPQLLTRESLIIDPLCFLEEGNQVLRINEEVGVASWIRLLSAAMVWAALGGYSDQIDWNNTNVWTPVLSEKQLTTDTIPEFLDQIRVGEQWFDRQVWHSGWSEDRGIPPEIYTFKIAFPLVISRKPTTIFKHTFFTWATWYVRFSSDWPIRKALKGFATLCQ